MGKKGFSATTFVLVAVLIGALFMVSKSVTPPPAAPPEPPPKEPIAAKAAPMQKPLTPPGKAPNAEMMERMRKMHDVTAKNGGKPPKPKFNPNTIEVTSDYWHQAQMGHQGEVTMREKVAQANREEAMKKVQIGAVPPVPPRAAVPPPVQNSPTAPVPTTQRQ